MNSLMKDWQGHSRLDAHDEFVRNSFAPQAAEHIIAAIRDPQNPRGVYHRQQLLFVCKEALLVCPESGGKDPTVPPHGGEMGRVLLMANDLLPKRVTGPAPTSEQMINVMSEFIPIAEASGTYKAIHKILRTRLMLDRFFPNGGAGIRKVFEHATGAPLDDYLALCFATLCRYFDLDLEKFKADPANFLLSEQWYRTVPSCAPFLASFLAEISATASEFRKQIGERNSAANDFTCFRGKPIFNNENGYFMIDAQFLAEKSESGVFWCVNQALPRPERLQFHQDWGIAFERYINWLLGESVDGSLNRVCPNPRFADTGEEVCDALVLCGDAILFVESKGATFTAEAKYGAQPEELHDEIEEKFVQTNGQRKGIGQLALRIGEAFNKRHPRAIEGVCTSAVNRVFPVLITRDDIGAALVMNAYLASRFRDLFSHKSVSVRVTPPFSLSSQDVEMICGYLREASFADLLEERYRSDRRLLSSFWLVDNAVIDRIGDRECKAFSDASQSYFEGLTKTLFPTGEAVY